MVYKLIAVIRADRVQLERQTLLDVHHAGRNSERRLAPHSTALRPTAQYIRHG